jgi:hypothetical protein
MLQGSLVLISLISPLLKIFSSKIFQIEKYSLVFLILSRSFLEMDYDKTVCEYRAGKWSVFSFK